MYRPGFCPQCDTQIMVKDGNGFFTAMKYNFRQADLYLPNGHRIRTAICSDCLAASDNEKLMKAILDPGSRAAQQEVLSQLKIMVDKVGLPDKIAEVSPRRPLKRDIQEISQKIKKDKEVKHGR